MNRLLQEIQDRWAGHPWDDWLGNGGKLAKAQADILYLVGRCKAAEALIEIDEAIIAVLGESGSVGQTAAWQKWQQATTEQEAADVH